MKKWRLATICLIALINLFANPAWAGDLTNPATAGATNIQATAADEGCALQIVIYRVEKGQEVASVATFTDLTWLRQMGYQGCRENGEQQMEPQVTL